MEELCPDELDRQDCPFDSNVAHVMASHDSGCAGPKVLRQSLNTRTEASVIEQVEASVGSRAGERVCHIRRPVLERLLRNITPKRIEDSLRRHGRRKWQRSSSQCLAQHEQVGNHPCFDERETRAGAIEPGRDLIEDEQDPMLLTGAPNSLELSPLVEPHPSCTLHERLDNDARYCFRDSIQLALEIVVVESGDRDMHGVDPKAVECSVHSGVGITERHRRERVAVIGAFETDNTPPPVVATVVMELQRHFERDLHGHGATL